MYLQMAVKRKRLLKVTDTLSEWESCTLFLLSTSMRQCSIQLFCTSCRNSTFGNVHHFVQQTLLTEFVTVGSELLFKNTPLKNSASLNSRYSCLTNSTNSHRKYVQTSISGIKWMWNSSCGLVSPRKQLLTGTFWEKFLCPPTLSWRGWEAQMAH